MRRLTATAFEPVALSELELEPGARSPDAEAVARADPAGQRRRILVRLHGEPLGVLELGEHPRNEVDVAALARQRFAERIAEHRRLDGSGVREPPRCVREREAFRRRAPFASVVVATRNRAGTLAKTLDDLLRLDYPEFEVVVVDNAPATDETWQLVAQLATTGRIRQVREPLPGLAVAHNRGLAAAQGAIVAFTDDDVRVDRSWLLELALGFEAAADVACVTGLILPLELETPAQLWLEDAVGLNKGFEPKLFDRRTNRPRSRLFPYAPGILGSGANMAFRRDVLERLGGFDPATGTGTRARGGDDLAAFFDVIAAGHTLAYRPSAIVRHAHRRDLDGLEAQIEAYGAGLGAFFAKVVLDRPGRALEIAWRVPLGIAHRSGARCADLPAPRGLALREARGLVSGPFGYVLERRRRGARA